jgi:hypothetical protein
MSQRLAFMNSSLPCDKAARQKTFRRKSEFPQRIYVKDLRPENQLKGVVVAIRSVQEYRVIGAQDSEASAARQP